MNGEFDPVSREDFIAFISSRDLCRSVHHICEPPMVMYSEQDTKWPDGVVAYYDDDCGEQKNFKIKRGDVK